MSAADGARLATLDDVRREIRETLEAVKANAEREAEPDEDGRRVPAEGQAYLFTGDLDVALSRLAPRSEACAAYVCGEGERHEPKMGVAPGVHFCIVEEHACRNCRRTYAACRGYAQPQACAGCGHDVAAHDDEVGCYVEVGRGPCPCRRGVASRSPATDRDVDGNPRIYPCAKCGIMRSKAEGGTTFTVCDECWDAEPATEAQPATQGHEQRGCKHYCDDDPFGPNPCQWHGAGGWLFSDTESHRPDDVCARPGCGVARKDHRMPIHTPPAAQVTEAQPAEEQLSDDAQRGLYGKYRVERISDPTGKHRDCWYFVLDAPHDPFAVPALAAYANACAAQYPALAADLWKKLDAASPAPAPTVLPEWAKPVAHRYLFWWHDGKSEVWRNDAGDWNGQRPHAEQGLYAASDYDALRTAAEALARENAALKARSRADEESLRIANDTVARTNQDFRDQLVHSADKIKAESERADAEKARADALQDELARTHAILTDDDEESVVGAAEQRMRDLESWKEMSATDSERAARAEAALAEIASAIGTTEFMDPPDGGDVPLAEQVRRMSAALAEMRARWEMAVPK